MSLRLKKTRASQIFLRAHLDHERLEILNIDALKFDRRSFLRIAPEIGLAISYNIRARYCASRHDVSQRDCAAFFRIASRMITGTGVQIGEFCACHVSAASRFRSGAICRDPLIAHGDDQLL